MSKFSLGVRSEVGGERCCLQFIILEQVFRLDQLEAWKFLLLGQALVLLLLRRSLLELVN